MNEYEQYERQRDRDAKLRDEIHAIRLREANVQLGLAMAFGLIVFASFFWFVVLGHGH